MKTVLDLERPWRVASAPPGLAPRPPEWKWDALPVLQEEVVVESDAEPDVLPGEEQK